MPNQPLLLSDRPSDLSTGGFHQQLKRLESLQILMTQGSSVVNDVVEFMAKARAELVSLRQEQALTSRLKETTAVDTASMTARMSDLEQSLASSEVDAIELGLQVVRLQGELAKTAVRKPKEQEAVRQNEESMRALKTAQERVAELEKLLFQERLIHEQTLRREREAETKGRLGEITQLKTRMTALEQQLESERERRVRLMEVLKTREVAVAPVFPQRENV